MAKHNLPNGKARRGPKGSAKRAKHRGSNPHASRGPWPVAEDGKREVLRRSAEAPLAIQSRELTSAYPPIHLIANALYGKLGRPQIGRELTVFECWQRALDSLSFEQWVRAMRMRHYGGCSFRQFCNMAYSFG